MTGTWINGSVVLDTSPDWPEGSRVCVEQTRDEESLGLRDEDWPTDPEGIAQLLARVEQIEPLEMSPEEEAEFWGWQRKISKYTYRCPWPVSGELGVTGGMTR